MSITVWLQSLDFILRKRRTLTESEVRYYMRQLVEGCRYIHSRHIIHRDLKLGNMLLNGNMKMKIADFGLATRVAYKGEKKTWVCSIYMGQILFNEAFEWWRLSSRSAIMNSVWIHLARHCEKWLLMSFVNLKNKINSILHDSDILKFELVRVKCRFIRVELSLNLFCSPSGQVIYYVFQPWIRCNVIVVRQHYYITTLCWIADCGHKALFHLRSVE